MINWFDVIILVLVLIFGLKGIKSGIIREIFGLFGIIGGVYFAIKYKNQAGLWINDNIYNLTKIGVIDAHGTQIIVGFLALLFGIWIISLILGEIISKLLRLSGLEIVDRIGGFVFGATKVFLIFSIFLVLIKSSVFLNDKINPYLKNSITTPFLMNFGRKIMQFDIKTVVRETNETDKNTTENK